MKLKTRLIAYTFFVLLGLSLGTFLSSLSGMDVMFGGVPEHGLPSDLYPQPRPYDASKATVAILLGNPYTEVTDFMIPYELFSATGAYNVYGVAADRELRTLTGGLDIVPDYSFDDLDRLLGKSPDIIVTPAMLGINEAQNRPLLDWLQAQAATSPDTLFFSICGGTQVLAAAGIIDGRNVTSFWAEIDGFEQSYPNVNWLRGLRYVQDGNIISSAGITSGIDATLFIISQQLGIERAQTLAEQLHYPHFDFVLNPEVEQYYAAPADAIFLANAAYQWKHANYGILLYDGIDELELASVFDTYPASLTTQTYAIAPEQQIIHTRYGLNLYPRYSYSNSPVIERLIVAGSEAYELAAKSSSLWQNANVPLVYLHTEMPEAFAFDAPLLDLARAQNVPSASFAMKRLEYRPLELQLVGTSWPFKLAVPPLLMSLASIAVLALLETLHYRFRGKSSKSG